MDEAIADLWEDKLRPWLEALEVERRTAVRNLWVWGGAGAVIGLVLAAGAVLFSDVNGWLIFAGPFLGVITALFGFQRLTELQKRIKLELNAQIAGAFGLSYEAAPGQPERFDRYRTLTLVPHHHRRSFQDQFSGQMSGCDVVFHEARLQERRTRTVTQNGRTRTETYYVQVFNGILLTIDFPKKVEGITVVTRDAGWFNGLSGFGFKVDGRKLERVGLVDPEFEKIFEAYGDDQVMARYMLTPSFMERLLDLETSLKGKQVRAAFDAHSGGGELLIAAETGNLFETGSMFKPLADQERVQSVVEEIRLIAGIVDLLVKPASLETDE